MHFQVILNRDGGTLRTTDMKQFTAAIRTTLEGAGHTVDIEVMKGDGVEAALDAAKACACDVVMVGGGDGTISAAAARLKDTGKALAILPAGTMNLFARSLGIPLQLEEALAALAEGRMRDVDVASANGRVFVHQFSVGLHAKLIRLRERQTFRSRIGKIWASLRAGSTAFFRPPRMRMELDIDGTASTVATAGIGISNNIFGEGHIPYTDTPDGGVLGVYVTRARRRRDLAFFVLNVALGRWRDNDKVAIHRAREVELTVLAGDERFGCAIDGELCDMERVTRLRVHPACLKVLVPA